MRRQTCAAALGVVILASGGVVTARTVRGSQQPGDAGQYGCSEATLRGTYALQFTGSRPVRPPFPAGIETFTGIGTRTYDGEGSFTQVTNVKGAVTGLEPENVQSAGTYQVNEDCTGSTTSQFVGGGPVITATLVIVDHGREVLTTVMTPVAIFNSGVQRRMFSH